MPKCFNCRTPYREGQKFCKACGTSLVNPAVKPMSCPRCRTVLAANQSFCHECGAVLAPVSKPARAQPRSRRQWPQGFVDRVVKGYPAHILALVGGCLLVLIVLAVGVNWLGGWGSISSLLSLTGQGKTTASTPKPAGEIPTSGVLGPPYFSKPTDLAKLNPPTAKGGAITAPNQELSPKEEMEEVLFNLRKGQEEKDLTLYMSCFSPTYPDLEQKKEDTLKIWKTFEFSQMLFNIEDIQEVAPDTQVALVTWEIQARNLNTQKVATSSQKYKVWFIKEAGKWLIKSLEKEGKEAKEMKEAEHD
jgi:hypothetical protein